MRRSKALLAAMLGAAAIGVSALADHTPENPDGRRISSPLLAGAQIDPETLRIVERACQSCHSERTQWPWYSHVPPASWLIHRDVARARDRFDLTRWGWYSALEKQALLSAIGAAARTGVMPPRRYRIFHPESDLSPPERERLYRWTRAERLRLREYDDPAPMSGDNRFLWDRRF
jgi:hypothetical protein